MNLPIYPKLAEQENCEFPNRKNCNYNDQEKLSRCIHMKYDNTKSIFSNKRWYCEYKKLKLQRKSDTSKNNLKGEGSNDVALYTKPDNPLLPKGS